MSAVCGSFVQVIWCAKLCDQRKLMSYVCIILPFFPVHSLCIDTQYSCLWAKKVMPLIYFFCSLCWPLLWSTLTSPSGYNIVDHMSCNYAWVHIHVTVYVYLNEWLPFYLLLLSPFPPRISAELRCPFFPFPMSQDPFQHGTGNLRITGSRIRLQGRAEFTDTLYTQTIAADQVSLHTINIL